MYSFEVAAELAHLYALEIDAAQAYANAITLAGAGHVRDELRLFSLEHQRHALVLLDAIIRLGHNVPEVEPDVKGVVIGALTVPQRPLTLEDVLEGMRGNEQLANSVYAKALAKPIPRGVVEILRPMAAEERNHLDWLERMVSRRIWESAFAGHP
jgi:hypothetical protein